MRNVTKLFIPLLLSACAAPNMTSPATYTSPLAYTCDDGSTLRVRLTASGAYVRVRDGEEMLLPQLPAAAGLAYGTAERQLRGQDTEATWTVAGRPSARCVVAR